MATLDKIRICGIRSFGCEEEDVQTVKFRKPLTLILGENGCGKSTIIECLRYVTAQKEPAGKGTFVHDPSLTNRSTVKGMVKLRMLDVKGFVVDLCRQVQATKTKKSLTIKSLDNVITRTNKDTKERVSISNRCADFTYEISRIFGVSRAILENVIFCSQEDAHWPLDTDQKLKEKFDQIFDSDKYNKCVNKVRDKKKKVKDTIKNSETVLKYLKQNKTMAVEKRRVIEKTNQKIENCYLEIQDLNSVLEEVENSLKDINEKEWEMSKNHTNIEMKKAQVKGLEENITELNRRIRNKFEGTTEELEKELNNFTELLNARQIEILHEEDRIKNFNEEETKLSGDLMKKQGMLGQLLNEKELQQERKAERTQKLKGLASDLKINVPSQMQSQAGVESLMKMVKAKVVDEEDELAKMKLFFEEEEIESQANIDKLREESLIAQNDFSNMEERLKNSQTELANIKKELNEMDQSASKLVNLESTLSKVSEEIKNLEESTDPKELKINVKKSTDDRNKLEERLSEIEDEVKTLQQKSSLQTELDVQNDLKSNKESQIRRLINKHEDSLKGLLGKMPESGFKAAIQNHIENARQKVKELTIARSKKEKESTESEMKRKHLREKLKAKEDVLRANEEEIYEVCSGEDFEETITHVKRQLEDLQNIKGTLSSSEFMYQRYIRALQKTQPCCPLCHRDFEQQTEAQSLVDELSSKIREVPNKLLENKNQLEEKQVKYNKLLVLRTKHEQISELKNKEIPDLRSELDKTEKTLKKVQKELNDIEGEMYSPQTDEAICISLQNDMVLLDQLQSEKRQLEKQLEKLENQLGGRGADKDALKKCLNEQDATRQKLKETRKRVEELQSKLSNFNEQLQVKQSQKNSLMEQINKIQGGVGQKKMLIENLGKLQSKESVEKVELEKLRKNLNIVRKKLQDAVSVKNAEKLKNSEKIEKMSQAVNGLLKKLHDIEGIVKIIEAHEKKGLDDKIEEVQSAMSKIEEALKDLKIGREQASKKISDTKKALSNQELRERELEDNLKLRQKTVEEESLRKEVAVLEEKFGHVNFNVILNEKRKLKSKEEDIGKNKAQIQGRLVEMESQVKGLEKELLDKPFKTIDDDYNKEYLKYEVLKAIFSDLDRYATTMEYAMMTYHKQQMTRVNAFIREYWRKIYQGNDIDYIEIQTDNIESTEKRRNYSYKVIQVKSNVCIDMRNRCSAGQKMLASLIIRMALAETFSSNCGILTLDEPTTNLDRRNIKNLARVLNEIITAKQKTSNPNFQLIVITHDEEFLQELMELDLINEYVRVDRNPRGKTKITNRFLTDSPFTMAHANRIPNQYDYD